MTPSENLAREYFTKTFAKHGAKPAGLDWNGEASQIKRLEVLVEQIPDVENFSVNDVGCGYGSLIQTLHGSGKESFTYTGYDLVKEMTAEGRKLWGQNHSDISFITGGIASLKTADYTLASGTFNMKQDVSHQVWEDYVISSLTAMLENTDKRLAANFLTAYSDAEFMRDDLYYPDPRFLFDFGMKQTGSAAIRHDYGLYDFTLIINKR